MSIESTYPTTVAELLQGMPIALVGLRSGIAENFLDKGVKTIYDLLHVNIGELATAISGMGKANYTLIQEVRDQLGTAEWSIDEIAEFRFLPNVAIVPDTVRYVQQTNYIDFPYIFVHVVNAILRTQDERQYKILKHRFGLDGETTYTLEQLGSAFDITRERVRQMEEKALTHLRRFLITGELSDKYNIRINEFIRLEARSLKNEVESRFAIVTLNEISQIFETRYGQMIARPYLDVLIAIFNYEPLLNIPVNHYSTWIVNRNQADISLIRKCSQDIIHLLEDQPKPFSSFKLLIEINNTKKGKQYNQTTVQQALRVLSDLEETLKEGYQLRIETLPNYEAMVYRVLFEKGEPMHTDEMVREINHRLALAGSRKRVNRRVSARFSNNRWFVPQGRSGVWALAEWDNVNTATILELMQTYLYKRNEAVSADEIYEYVREQRPVSRNSIILYLSTNELFEQFSDNTWGLATWDKPERPLDETGLWNVDAVADFVANYFRERKSRTVSWGELTQALAQTMGKPRRSAAGKLRYSPAVETITIEGERHAKFVLNYKELIEQGDPRYKHRKTIRDDVQRAIREILRKSPEFSLLVSELRTKVVKETGCNPRTFFSYLYTMDDVQPVREDKKVKYTLVTQSEVPKFPQLKDIADDKLREDIERGIALLTIDAIDMGLFQLGKVFENTLKSYIVKARAANVFTVNNNDVGTLQNMIKKVEAEGIITDTTALNFLRLERNERAHGEVPSIEERRVMLKNSKQFADMYIDYIKLLFDRMIEFGNPLT